MSFDIDWQDQSLSRGHFKDNMKYDWLMMM